MAEKLLPYVLRELQARKGEWPTVARETELDYSWLTKLAQGRIPDPSVNRIQKLADYFRSRGSLQQGNAGRATCA